MLCYEFGPFKLNADHRTLMRDGSPVSLRAKAADVLLVLLKNAGELVDKDALMAEVWPEAFVEESNLSQCIFILRRALGDQRSDAQYIETVAKRGYRFTAPVKVAQLSTASENGKKTGEAERSPRLAVLPFLNSSGDSKLEYLADGVGDNLINSLSQISRLRVMSRSSVFRYRSGDGDPQLIAKELGVDAILLGKIGSLPTGLAINVELVDAQNGWQLWGRNFECELSDIVEIQQEIVRQITTSLKLTLTGDEEKRITARYTDNSDAYQAYLEGRFHWSRYTREGIERAIVYFCRAIELDPNYALAHSAVIDCYLRLIANYLPPEPNVDPSPNVETPSDTCEVQKDTTSNVSIDSESRVKLRHEWDWKGAERELRRANELKADYPAAHQWYAAFLFVRGMYQKSAGKSGQRIDLFSSKLPPQIRSASLTQSEEVQVYCTIGREQIVIGNFEGAKLILERWLPKRGWPQLSHLDPHVAADLLFTLGNLIASLAFTGQINKGNKRAESYLSGSIAIFQYLGRQIPAAEAQIELGRCLYREGLFEEAKEILTLALETLPSNQTELISLCLSVYGCVERDSGSLWDSLEKLESASSLETGELVTGFRHLQLATTLKELGNSESRDDFYKEAGHHFQKALFEFEAIGNHRTTAATENNYGYLLLNLGRYEECEYHLLRALKLFRSFSDPIRAAQVNETLTQMYLCLNDLPRAELSINDAISVLERADGAALLAEALITKGIVTCRLRRFDEARQCFEGGHRVAEQCGDNLGAGRALLTLLEEMGNRIDDREKYELKSRLQRFLSQTQQTLLLRRLEKVIAD